MRHAGRARCHAGVVNVAAVSGLVAAVSALVAPSAAHTIAAPNAGHQVPAAAIFAAIAAAGVIGIVGATLLGRRAGRRSLEQRLTALSTRLSADTPGGEPAGIEQALGHLEQVTDRAAEAVASASSDAMRLRRALDTLPQGVIVCDENGDVVFRNPRAAGLMGGRHGDALAAQAVVDLLADAWTSGSAERTLDLYGPPRRTLVVRTQLIDDGRRTLGVIAVIDDISERRRLEEIRRDFVANVSHELRTPIGALGLLAETLAYEDDPAVRQRLANRIQNETFRVAKVIDDLLDLSRIESEGASHKEPTDLADLCHEVVEEMASAADTARVELGFAIEDSGFVIEADRRQMRSAIANLIDNAIKYSDKDSWVRVGLRRAEDGRIEISVADHGIGIPQKDLERIFERFYRVDQARSRQTGGTGLGLSIVRHAVNNHNGAVEVESREGAGTTFRILLPSSDGDGQ